MKRGVGKPPQFPRGQEQTTIQCLKRDKELMKALARLVAWEKWDEALALIREQSK